MSDNPLTPMPLPDGHAEILQKLEGHMVLLEYRLQHLGGGRYRVIDTGNGRLKMDDFDDLQAFAAANGVRNAASS